MSQSHDGWGEGWSSVEAPIRPTRATLHRPTPTKVSPTRRRNRLAIVWTIVGVFVLALGAAGFLGFGAWRAHGALMEAKAALPGLEAQLRNDPDAAGEQLATLQAHTRTAKAATAGPIWTFAGYLPFIGDDIQALRTISETVDRLAVDVLPRMTTAVQAVTPATLAPVAGHVNLAPIQQVRSDVVAADYAVGSSIAQLTRIDRGGLIAPLVEAADALESELAQARATTATAARAVELIPALFGADGPREWLLIAQNNAEQRASGGIAGTIVQLIADNGSVEFGNTASAQTIGQFDALPLTQQELEIWGERPGQYLQNITMTPDFPRTAQLATQIWEQARGGQPRGVISIDPVALQSIIAATGPVTFDFDPRPASGVSAGSIDTITLTGTNTVSFLLSEVYAKYEDPTVQDAVFAQAAKAVFQKLMAGDINAGRLVQVLNDAAEQGRIMVWSAIDREQEYLAGTILAGEWRGAAPAGGVSVETSPVVGVFLDLFMASKIGYYLNQDIQVTNVEARPNGSQAFTVTVSLTNILDPAAAATLPGYVIGDGPADGTLGVYIRLSTPAGGAVRSVLDAGGNPVSVEQDTYRDMVVAKSYLYVAPGETQTLTFNLVSGQDQSGPIQLRQTPAVR